MRLLALVVLVWLMPAAAHAFTCTWNKATGSSWNTAANWNNCNSTVPQSTDAVVFSGTGVGNCTLNTNASVASISINSGYTGQLIQSTYSITTTGVFAEAAGTFTGGSNRITVGTNVNLSGGAFTATSGLTEVNGVFNRTGGTFAHNNGQVMLSGNMGGTFATNGAAFYNLTLNDMLAGYWKLDDGGTPAVDVSGYGHNAVLSGTPTWAAGPAQQFTNGNAMVLSGTAQYGQITRTADLEPAAITIAVWVKRNGTQVQYAKIIEKDYSGGVSPYGSYSLEMKSEGVDSGQVGFHTGHSGPTTDVLLSTADAAPDGTWTHVAAVYGPSGAAPQKRLYINGVLNASATLSSAIIYNSGNLYFGQNGSGGQYYKGTMDEVRIYNKALYDSEIYGLYAGSQAGSKNGTHTVTGSPSVARSGDRVGAVERRRHDDHGLGELAELRRAVERGDRNRHHERHRQ